MPFLALFCDVNRTGFISICYFEQQLSRRSSGVNHLASGIQENNDVFIFLDDLRRELSKPEREEMSLSISSKFATMDLGEIQAASSNSGAFYAYIRLNPPICLATCDSHSLACTFVA
jgi:hypothetical protein